MAVAIAAASKAGAAAGAAIAEEEEEEEEYTPPSPPLPLYPWQMPLNPHTMSDRSATGPRRSVAEAVDMTVRSVGTKMRVMAWSAKVGVPRGVVVVAVVELVVDGVEGAQRAAAS